MDSRPIDNAKKALLTKIHQRFVEIVVARILNSTHSCKSDAVKLIQFISNSLCTNGIKLN